MFLERYNRTGMRDAYNVLKLLEDKKGGKNMRGPEDEDVIHPEEEKAQEDAQDIAQEQAEGADDPDLVEDEDEEDE